MIYASILFEDSFNIDTKFSIYETFYCCIIPYKLSKIDTIL